MFKKYKNGGFSLVELIIAIAILATLTIIIVPTYIHLNQEAKLNKDITKFNSICTVFASSCGEPDVRKEMDGLYNGNDIIIVCRIDEAGTVNIGESEIFGSYTDALYNTKLWLDASQMFDNTYSVENSQFRNQYLIFYITPKTSTSVAKCEYEIVNAHPFNEEV